MIDVGALRVIRAIAAEGSFTGAALVIGSSQPAVSQLVKRLEERLGTPVVERSGRSVRLTQAGEILLRCADEVLPTMDLAEEEVAALTGLRAGRVRLMAFPSSSATLVPRALAALRREHPDIEVLFTEAEPPESMAALRAGGCDVAVTFAYAGMQTDEFADDLATMVDRPLLTDEVRLVLPRTHPRAGDATARLADFASESWIAGCPRCRGHLLALAHEADFEPHVTFETEDYVAVLGLVAAGLGVALVPDLILAAAHNAEVVAIPLDPPSRRTIHAVTTPDLERVPAVSALLTALCQARVPDSVHAPA